MRHYGSKHIHYHLFIRRADLVPAKLGPGRSVQALPYKVHFDGKLRWVRKTMNPDIFWFTANGQRISLHITE